MLIPLRTSRELRRRPRVTGTLIIVNMLVYLLGLVLESSGIMSLERLIDLGSLSGGDVLSRPWTLVTYQFLHDPTSIWHLAFNMLFLWVFGSAVEDRLGRRGFTAFYLVGGVVAGLAHVAWSPAPVIGASGAVAATTGAFAALAPRARVLVLVFFFLIMTISVPALWFVAFYVAIDFLRSAGDLLGGSSRVAYVAHLAGYAFGFGTAVGLLASGHLPRDDFDIWFLYKQHRRRTAFRRITRDTPAGPWDAPTADTDARLADRARRRARTEVDPGPPPDPVLTRGRQEIERLVNEHRLDEAAAAYIALRRTHPDATIAPDRQLDVANQLHAEGHEHEASEAYRLLLERAPVHPRADEVRLLLSALYIRALGRPEDARPLLDRLDENRVDAGLRDLLGQLRDEAGPGPAPETTPEADAADAADEEPDADRGR